MWLIVNVGGGPTPDKPSVTLSAHADKGEINGFMNIRVADIRGCYELWKSRGAEFITEPMDKCPSGRPPHATPVRDVGRVYASPKASCVVAEVVALAR